MPPMSSQQAENGNSPATTLGKGRESTYRAEADLPGFSAGGIPEEGGEWGRRALKGSSRLTKPWGLEGEGRG